MDHATIQDVHEHVTDIQTCVADFRAHGWSMTALAFETLAEVALHKGVLGLPLAENAAREANDLLQLIPDETRTGF